MLRGMLRRSVLTVRGALGALGALAALGVPCGATAQEMVTPRNQFAVMLGPSVGGVFHQKSGALLGAELSLVYLDEGLWFGFYGDALYDMGLGRARMSFGPEGGLGPFGFDLGYVREVGESQPMQGWRVRGILSAFGVISAYLGPGVIQQGERRQVYREGGLLFKMPLALF